jgi:hypothetical protein
MRLCRSLIRRGGHLRFAANHSCPSTDFLARAKALGATQKTAFRVALELQANESKAELAQAIALAKMEAAVAQAKINGLIELMKKEHEHTLSCSVAFFERELAVFSKRCAYSAI